MHILVIGMLDEREEALSLLKERIERRGHEAILADVSIGTGAIVPALEPEITCEEIAQAGGTTIDAVKGMLAKERDKATSIMAEGLTRKALELYQEGKLDGVIAVGGMTGTVMSITAMKALPFGLPKLLISSVTAMPAYARRFAEYFSVRDITVMHSVVDTVGLNPLVHNLMINGAGAICGMVEAYEPPAKPDKPVVAMTELGFCDKAAGYVRERIQEEYNIVSFHATGLGDRAVEDLISQGFFDAFIDLVPAGLSEYLLGGNRAAGPDRLEAACDRGIPYLLTPCGFDMISCGPIERRDKGDPLWVSRRLAERKLLIQDALRVQARTSAEEMDTIARAVADKLNKHKNRRAVKFLIPLRGFSSLSVEGGQLHDPEVDRAFIAALKEYLNPEIEVIEVDTHINTPEFAQAVTAALGEVFEK